MMDRLSEEERLESKDRAADIEIETQLAREGEEVKRIIIGEFGKRDTEIISEVVIDYLNELGINPSTFSFYIEVNYSEEEEKD